MIAQGYDREQIKRLPSHGVADTIEAQARDTVNEGTQKRGDEGQNTAGRLIRVTEHCADGLRGQRLIRKRRA